MKVYAVVAAYNESQTVRGVVEKLLQKVQKVVVVDDGSKDSTAQTARLGGATVLQHFLNRGQGAALKTGIDFSLQDGADIIITFDADGQHTTDDLDELILPIKEGKADIVLGSRFITRKTLEMPAQSLENNGRYMKFNQVIQNKKIPFARYFVLKGGVLFTRLTTGLSITDTHNGLRAFSRKAAFAIQVFQNGYAHASEILEQISKKNLIYTEVPVSIHYTEYSRQKGQSVFNSFKIVWDLLIASITK